VNRIQNFAAATDVAQTQTGLILCGPIAAAKSGKNIIIALRTASVNIFVTCHGNKIQIKPMKTTGASSIFS
jgi:hypothetical protein